MGRPTWRHATTEPNVVIQALEERIALAVFSVTNINNTGAGSFRQAIRDANAGGARADTIVFDAAFFSVPRDRRPELSGAVRERQRGTDRNRPGLVPADDPDGLHPEPGQQQGAGLVRAGADDGRQRQQQRRRAVLCGRQ